MINNKKIVGIIPARMESSRFPGKPLKLIHGMPMVVHVYKRSELCKDLDELYIATDSQKIKETVEKYNCKVIMTGECAGAVDRTGAAIKDMACDVAVCIQGDEPLVLPEHISTAVKALLDDDEAGVSCLCMGTDQFDSTDEIKVVLNEKNDMIFLSRSDIPSTAKIKHNNLLKQYCIIPFKKDFLLKFINTERTPLEKIEGIDLLRCVEKGWKIKGAKVENAIIQSVDTQADLELVEELMKKDELKGQYLS